MHFHFRLKLVLNNVIEKLKKIINQKKKTTSFIKFLKTKKKKKNI